MSIMHKTLPLANLFKAMRKIDAFDSLTLDGANDAVLTDRGNVMVRNGAMFDLIGNVGKLKGAAKLSRACKMVNDHRNTVKG